MIVAQLLPPPVFSLHLLLQSVPFQYLPRQLLMVMKYAVAPIFSLHLLMRSLPMPVLSHLTSQGNIQVHDNRGTFLGNFIIERDMTKNMGVENVTLKVDSAMEYYETLDHFNMKERFTLRYNGAGTVHCPEEPLKGSLAKFWDWIALANYTGKKEIHDVEYDEWQYRAANVEVAVLVPQTNPNIPWFYLYHTGAITVGYEFTSFVATEPPADDFAIPKECTPAGHRINRVPFYNLKPIP